MESTRLTETALKIYIHMVESGVPLSAREISRNLGVPVSTVAYYLKKFEDMGIVRNTSTGYIVVKKIDVEGFIYVGGKLLPKFYIYSFFFLGLLIGEIIVYILTGNSSLWTLLTFMVTSIALTLFLYEGLQFRRKIYR